MANIENMICWNASEWRADVQFERNGDLLHVKGLGKVQVNQVFRGVSA